MKITTLLIIAMTMAMPAAFGLETSSTNELEISRFGGHSRFGHGLGHGFGRFGGHGFNRFGHGFGRFGGHGFGRFGGLGHFGGFRHGFGHGFGHRFR